MAKRFLMVCLVVLLSLPGTGWAENPQKDPATDGEQVFTGRSEFQNLRTFLDFFTDATEGLGVVFQDARVSPLIRSEAWYELPIELGWLATQDTLVPLLEKMMAYSFADSRLAHGAICISVCAETRGDGQPLLTVTGNEKLICHGGPGKPAGDDPATFWEAVAKRNQVVLRAFRALLKITTFTPQVKKKALGGGVGPGKTWITNIRIDSDHRVQLTAYGLDAKQPTQLGDDLLKSGAFVEVFLSNMNRNTYEKVPVWRFDLVARLN